jgi:ABC-type transport system involved in cytochrome c biogenesis permease subunit
LVLGLIGVARFFADAQPYAREPASRAWGVVHGVSILLASVAVLVGFVAGIMYLEQARRLKKKLPPIRGLRLPSLEWLARANSRAIVVSVLMLAVGLASGEVLRLLSRGDRLPWYDPVVLSTVCVFLWLLAAAVVGVLYRPAQAGRKVAYLTLVSFVALVVALALVLSVDTQHGGRQARAVVGCRLSVVGRSEIAAWRNPAVGTSQRSFLDEPQPTPPTQSGGVSIPPIPALNP